uniref:Uncharacterized protein n=1 Tax=Anopheles culicifacies TaxID=139723 RepID=A0A182M0S1_9DIPT
MTRERERAHAWRLKSSPCEEVIGVHDHVHEGVDEAHKHTVTTGEPFDATPNQHHHAGVMIHVQEANLVLFLAQYEEDRVQQIEYFHEKVVVTAPCNHSRYLRW